MQGHYCRSKGLWLCWCLCFFFGRVQSIFLYQTPQNDEMKALCRPKLQFSMFNELRRYCLQQWEFAISCAEQLKDLSTAWIIREFPSDPFDQTYSCIRVIYWRAKRTLVNETCPGKVIKNHGAGRITRHYITIEKKLNQEKKMSLLSHLPLVFILKPLFEWGGVMMAHCPLADMSELSSNHIS